MRKFLFGFLVFVSLYHIVVTYFSFGLGRLSPYKILILRDVLWIVATLTFVLGHRSFIKKYLLQWGNLWMLFIVLLISGITTSIAMGVDVSRIIVGIKYSVYYILPLLSGLYIGGVWASTLSEVNFKKWIAHFRKILICILIVGWIWQICKNIAPGFMSMIGYGPLGDYVFGQNPPLYYLTGPNGFQRWSGIFSGPNNYGYLLVAFFGLYRYGIRAYVSSMSGKIALWSLFIVTLLATLSRGAILGVLIQIILVAYIIYSSQRKMIVFAILAGILSVFGLSVLKRDSTMAHIKAKVHSLQYVQNSPLGYGLGSSGPSAHSQGGYIPENYFVQLMMDLGVHGFIIRSVFWILLFLIIRRLYQQKPSSRNLLFFVSVGFLGLMIEGLFLHSLEDSMVNYMYFIVWGIVIGYVANEHRLFRAPH